MIKKSSCLENDYANDGLDIYLLQLQHSICTKFINLEHWKWVKKIYTFVIPYDHINILRESDHNI